MLLGFSISALLEKDLKDVFSFYLTSRTTLHCVASNMLHASYGLSEPALAREQEPLTQLI